MSAVPGLRTLRPATHTTRKSHSGATLQCSDHDSILDVHVRRACSYPSPVVCVIAVPLKKEEPDRLITTPQGAGRHSEPCNGSTITLVVLKIHLPKKGGNDEGNNVEEPYPDDTNQPLQGEKCAAASAAATGASTRELSNPAATTSSRASASSSFDGPTGKCLANAVAFARGGVREKHATDALGYMIAHDDLPLSTPEKDGFKTFVKALQPLHKPPTKPAITKSLEAKYEELRAHFDRRIQAADHLSITADVWTHANTMRSYLGLAVHFREGKFLFLILMNMPFLFAMKERGATRLKLPDLIAGDQLGVLAEVRDLLKLLEEATLMVSKGHSVTLSDVIPMVYGLKQGIQCFEFSHQVTFDLQQSFLKKLTKGLVE
ncbi:hypothetical protein HPB51_027559 [Rhipicephalus microplus]|uniref:Uncharacterized protein n=1 Tax=Rhipicephalus microplus TaxID=6941 RepID=A0A9J6D022_RHIMP|nr:hypothetical protein HPB51_027559 [Rhipicephalus microplus]